MKKRIVIDDYKLEAEGYKDNEIISQLLVVGAMLAKHFGISKREIIKCIKKVWKLKVD